MNKRDYAFDRTNFILLAAGMVVVIIGFILMSGGSSTEEAFNPDIFSTMRVKVAPVVCLIGFLSLIYGIVRKPKDDETDSLVVQDNPEVQTVQTTPNTQTTQTFKASLTNTSGKAITKQNRRKK